MIINNICRFARTILLGTCLIFPALNIQASILYVVNSQSRTLSRIDTNTDTVNNSFATLGNVPNKIVVDRDYIWCVNSGDNAVRKISKSTGATLGNIFVGAGSNPWDAVLDQGNLYVSGLFTGKVYRIDTSSGTVTGSISVGTAPEALLVEGGKLYVANAGNYAQNYAGSSVSVIDLASFSEVATIPTHANPQYLAVQNGMLHVSCTGNWTSLPGAICVIDMATNALAATIAIGGTPGCLWMANQNTAYVADSNGVNLYRYDPQSFQILNGADNPLPNGGSEIVGNSALIAVLCPNWSGNGTVKILHPDLGLWKQYTVAMMPTDLKMDSEPTPNDDALAPNISLKVWPNPARRDSMLGISTKSGLNADVHIYDLRGRKIASYPFREGNARISTQNYPSGVYLYRVVDSVDGSARAWGKFIVTDN